MCCTVFALGVLYPGPEPLATGIKHSQLASNTRNWHQTLATGIKHQQLASNTSNWHQTLAPRSKHSQLVLRLPIELQGPPTHMTTFDYLSILYLLNTKCKCHSRKERFGQICIMATHTKKQLFTKKQLGIERQKKYAMNNNKALITISH